MAADDWVPVRVHKAQVRRIKELIDAGALHRFNRPAQFYAYAADIALKQMIDELELEDRLKRNRSGAAPPCHCPADANSKHSEIVTNGH